MKLPKDNRPFWVHSRVLRMINDFATIESMKRVFLDLPKGTFNYNKHVKSIQKSGGRLTNTIDYFCQIPLFNIATWIPLWIMFIVMCFALDAILILWFVFKTFKKLVRNLK